MAIAGQGYILGLLCYNPHRSIIKRFSWLFSFLSFIEDHEVIDKIIKHLKLTFKAERPPPPQAQLSIAAEERSEYL